MWSYWRDKRGTPAEALEADYPHLLKSSPELQAAFELVRIGQARIDAIMFEKESQYDYDDQGDGLSGFLGRPIGY